MEILMRMAADLAARLDGPLHFRFVFQPLVAAIIAVSHGIKDAKLGEPAYFWTVLTRRDGRADLLKNGWKDVGKVFILACVLDVVYQWEIQSGFHIGQTLIVAAVLSLVPYLALRGTVNRVARLWTKPAKPVAQAWTKP